MARTRETPSPALRATAYHEAGHAVVAVHLGFSVSEVSIETDAGDDSNGRVAHAPPLMFEVDSKRDRRKLARAMIVAAFAGLEAQRLVDPDAPEWQGDHDRDNAFELSRDYGLLPRGCAFVGDDKHQAYLAGLRREAARLVRRLAGPIGSFAVSLIKARKMSGEKASAQISTMLAE